MDANGRCRFLHPQSLPPPLTCGESGSCRTASPRDATGSGKQSDTSSPPRNGNPHGSHAHRPGHRGAQRARKGTRPDSSRPPWIAPNRPHRPPRHAPAAPAPSVPCPPPDSCSCRATRPRRPDRLGPGQASAANGYYGGPQFSPSTWVAFGGSQYAPYANQATKQQQILIAEKVLASQGQRAWPSCGPKAGLGADRENPYPGSVTPPQPQVKPLSWYLSDDAGSGTRRWFRWRVTSTGTARTRRRRTIRRRRRSTWRTRGVRRRPRWRSVMPVTVLCWVVGTVRRRRSVSTCPTAASSISVTTTGRSVRSPSATVVTGGRSPVTGTATGR
ncbi:transglycosylase family protein [Streptomyces virginiae]|uniref:transglycosylase family protein n=1 Tax=Streptomyces virginiae TaxID=1961 RepID=UPI0037B078D4